MYITRKTHKETDWDKIALLAKSGELNVGDEISDELKNNEGITYTVAHITEDYVHFISKDCLKQRVPWNKNELHQKNPGSFRDSYLCKLLNESVWDLLPEDLQKVITPRKCVQIKDEWKESFLMNLWLPSEYEVFGKVWATGIREGEQFEIFKDRRNITKGAGQGGSWDAWWTMSSGGNKIHGGSASEVSYLSIANYFGGDRTSYFANQHVVPICFSIGRR
ncbi:MAG: hypothetical protein E7646_00030 [Ruminococcaceae bacterium]|nr:hypothetical protein [Oscillospiraceae bacterium]